MAKISAKDVAKLRKMTGAGMMDCKKALTETEGDFDAAIDILRTKGQKIASKRADREATEGVVLSKVSEDGKNAVMITLNCETDFVAKNEDFVAFGKQILDAAAQNMPATLEDLKKIELNGKTIEDEVVNQTGVIGEKLDVSYYALVKGETVSAYVHNGNRLATVVSFNDVIESEKAKDVAMQVAAMNPVAVNKESVSQEIIDKELEIGKAQAIEEGKPEDLAEKISKGRLNKFFKESTLLSQAFVKDNKKTVEQYIQEGNKNITVNDFKRYSL